MLVLGHFSQQLRDVLNNFFAVCMLVTVIFAHEIDSNLSLGTGEPKKMKRNSTWHGVYNFWLNSKGLHFGNWH